MIKKIFGVAMTFGCLLLAAGEYCPIPQELTGEGISLDLGTGRLTVQDRQVTINKVAEFAEELMEKYLRPNVESGIVTKRDLELLQFCYAAMEARVIGCQRAYESKLKIPSNAKDLSRQDFGSGALPLKTKEELCKLEYAATDELGSLASLYASDLPNGFGFSDPQKVREALWDSRSAQKKSSYDDTRKQYIVYPLDSGGVEPLNWWVANKSLTIGASILGSAAVVGVLGYGAWVGGMSGALAAIPGPGWVILAVGGGCVLAVNAYTSYCDKKEVQRLIKNEDDVNLYLGRVRDRSRYLGAVLEDEDGPYQTAYMGIVNVQYLVERMARLPGLSDRNRRELQDCVDKIRQNSKDVLTRFEDVFVSYPLMVDVLGATSVCYYLNYLSYIRENKMDGLFYQLFGDAKIDGGKIEKVRENYLDRVREVGEIGSRYRRFCTGWILDGQIAHYNNYLATTYATNSLGILRIKSKKEAEKYWENREALLADKDKSRVGSGLINDKRGPEFAELVAVLDTVKKDRLLKDILVAKTNPKRFDEWQQVVKTQLMDCSLYPSWNKIAATYIFPEGTRDILAAYEAYADVTDEMARAKTALVTLCHVLPAAELESLGALTNILQDVKSKDAAISALSREIKRRKLPEELEREVSKAYDTVDKLAEEWVKMLSEKCASNVSGETLSLQSVAEFYTQKINPLWTKIVQTERKWWRRWY